MKIEASPFKDFYRVVDPSLNLGDIYLSSEVMQYLENQEKLESLEDMQFLISLPTQEWEISDQAPVGTLGTLASVIFYVRGTVQQQDDRIICTIPYSLNSLS
jgi:hypothetical protein